MLIKTHTHNNANKKMRKYHFTFIQMLMHITIHKECSSPTTYIPFPTPRAFNKIHFPYLLPTTYIPFPIPRAYNIYTISHTSCLQHIYHFPYLFSYNIYTISHTSCMQQNTFPILIVCSYSRFKYHE